MEEDEFWSIVDKASRSPDPYTAIKASLAELSGERILDFHKILMETIASAYKFPLLAANFVIESYVSDDVFREFRAWLVSRGRESFTQAVVDPESIVDWLDPESVDDIDGEPMLSVALDAYVAVAGDEIGFFEKAVFVPDPEMVEEWPDSKGEFRNRWPRLVTAFWNDEEIRRMHAVETNAG